eukprot:10431560-Heterocapsa_arctica.AAC.1
MMHFRSSCRFLVELGETYRVSPRDDQAIVQVYQWDWVVDESRSHHAYHCSLLVVEAHDLVPLGDG